MVFKFGHIIWVLTHKEAEWVAVCYIYM